MMIQSKINSHDKNLEILKDIINSSVLEGNFRK